VTQDGHGRAASANAELEALQTSTMFVWDLVLGSTGVSSSLVTSLAMVAEEVENWINTVAANGVRWETQSMLVAILSHFWNWNMN
jgi:hypothetical protein